MSRLAAIWAEFLGLFVDDWGFALSILVWLGVVFAIVRSLGRPSAFVAALFFMGLTAILVESALRRSRVGRGR